MTSSLIESPVFLVGSERGGSTMLRLMLQHHPRIAFAPEFEFIVDRIADDEAAGWPELESYRDYLENHRIFRMYGLSIDPTRSYPELIRSFLAQILERKQGETSILGATVHYCFQHLPRLWPEARYLHLIRDPRDVARSVVGMGWAGNVWTGARVWIEAERHWDELRSRIRSDQFVEVHFERLVAEPTPELTRICAFLGIPFDPAMLSYPEHSTYEAPDPKLATQWRRKLSDREVRIVESSVGELLTARGFELSGLPPIQIDEAERRLLKRQDHWARFRYRLKFLGPSLFAADFLARRFGPAPVRRLIQRRVDALVNANLK